MHDTCLCLEETIFPFFLVCEGEGEGVASANDAPCDDA